MILKFAQGDVWVNKKKRGFILVPAITEKTLLFFFLLQNFANHIVKLSPFLCTSFLQ